MFPVNHAATALLLKKAYLTRMPFLLLAVQVPDLAWLLCKYALPGHNAFSYSHSILSVLSLAFLAWLALRALNRKVMCLAFAIGIVSHLVLDLIMMSNIPVAPFIGGPGLGLGLYSMPILAAVVEAGFGVMCWRIYRGRKALLAVIILFNIINLPFIFQDRIPAIASAALLHPEVFDTVMLVQILASSYFIWSFSNRPLSIMGPDEITRAVSERYGKVATNPSLGYNFPVGRKFAESVGYPAGLLDSLPRGLWESFTGAGNPQGYVDVRPGEKLLDLGCGAGLDLCIYSRKAGPHGKVCGLDISGAMLKKARKNLTAAGISNFELVEACSDKIPFPDGSFDIVTANGIYNLNPDKDAVMRDVHRILKEGGRTIFSEVMLVKPLERGVKSLDEWFRCIGGALTQEEFLVKMRANGFKDTRVLWSGKNMRTSHELAVSSVIYASK